MRLFAFASAAIFAAGSAQAVTTFDQDVTGNVIVGSGVTNGSFTVDRNEIAGVEIGLRGKLRFDPTNTPRNIFNSSGDGRYSFNAGAAPGGFGFDPNSPTTPVWSFDWSINTDYNGNGATVGDSGLTFLLSLDTDPGAAFDPASFNPINQPYFDHAFGTNSTGQGAGVNAADETEYATFLGTNNLVQNSWNYEFFNEASDEVFLSGLSGFDPSVPGVYTITLAAFDGATEVASASIDIVVNAVPVPAALPLLAGGLGLFGLVRARRRAA